MPYTKNKIRVNVPKRSGFDKTHRNSGTGLCGTLLPLLCDEVVPNTRVSLRINLATQLPPLVSDTYMNVKHKVEAFFVPGRLLCKSYEPWFCNTHPRVISQSINTQQDNVSFTDVTPAVPVLALNPSDNSNFAKIGSLADYLGFTGGVPVAGINISLLPFIAYHLIWQEYYRNPNVQNPAFCEEYGQVSAANPVTYPRISTITSTFFRYADASWATDNYIYTLNAADVNAFKCADGVSLFDLRQRNFGLDYFTGARPSAQMGSAAGVGLALPVVQDTQGNDVAVGSFTVQQLRAANSLQQFRERNNLPGTRLVEQVKARYGANLSDGVAQRPICIGSATYDYGSTGISQTAPAGSSPSGNYFDNVAAQYGRAYAAGKDFLIEDFTANEPGYIMVLHSMVPEVSYSYGVDPLFTRYTAPGCIVNMANPLLQNVGDQPIMTTELASDSVPQVFGYQDRFADFMFKRNSVHGEFSGAGAGGSLHNFVLQRLVGATPSLGNSFLQIPTTYLDDVLQVASSTSHVSYWYDCMLDYKVSMPLAEFSIPSLQDPAYEHGQRVSLNRNGQIF